MNTIRAASLTLLCLFVSRAIAEDWLRFRGPNGSGTSIETSTLPLRWSPTANLQWKVELPGAGVSSPIVVGDRVFVTAYSGYGLERENPGDIKNLVRHLICLDAATGERKWQADVAAKLPEDPYTGIGVTAHGYASHTPVSDGKLVFAFFGKSGLYAYDLDGTELWNSGVGTESDPWKWGTSSSPIEHKDLVIVTASAESQAIVGFDKRTGNQVWRQAAKGLDGMWGTPILVKVDDNRTDLVISVAKEVWGLNPETGKLRWFCVASESDQAHSSAIASDGIVFAFSGRNGGSIAVKAGGKGDVTDSHVVWSGSDTASFGTPLVHQSKIYLIGNGVLDVIDRESGSNLQQVRMKSPPGSSRGGGGRSGSANYSSPVIAGDKLFYLKGDGEMIVFSLGDKLEQLSVNRVTEDSESFGGSPAISDGRMFIRSSRHLYCVAEMGDQVEPQRIAQDETARDSASATESASTGRGGFGGQGSSAGRLDPNAIFTERDKDQDGKLTRDELEGSPLVARMRQMDTDKDQALSKEELVAGIATFFGRGGGGGFRSGNRKDTRPDRPQRPELEG